MDDARDPMTGGADEDAAIRLLRIAGPRAAVSATRTARVRAAVQTGWQVGLQRRARRRRVAFAILAAGAVVIAVGRFQGDPPATLAGESVAVVEQVDGVPQRVFDTGEETKTASLSRNDTIRTGEWIETDARARVALRFSNGTSVRLDAGSRARVLLASVVELAAGAAYVDTGSESGRFEIRTAMATARDVGTQFEVRLLAKTVRLRVRTGVVELKDRTRSVSGRAGTEITLSAAGVVSRPFTVHGSDWDWTARVSPPLNMEGMSVAAFLEQVAREHGWAVHYADPALAQEASGIILHSSVTDLSPHQMVDVAINASGLRHRLERGELMVLRAANEREADGVDAH
jgi:hypothetical protein